MFSIVGTLAGFVVTVIGTLGLAGLFGLMAVESFGVPPLPSEVILPFAGFLIASGTFPLVPTILVAVAGAMVGAFVAYAAGRWWRQRVTGLGFGPFRLEARHLVRMDAWFARHGEPTVALARLVPVVRAYISYPAGSAEMPPVRFGVYTLLGMVPFTVAFIYAGIALGHDWGILAHYFGYLDIAFIALVALFVVYVLYLYFAKVRPADLRAGRARGDPSAAPAPPAEEAPR